MSLGDPISITYNTVAKNLVKINQDSYGSEYYLDDGDQKYTLSVKHTIPSKGASGESHLVRLDVEHYSSGVLVRTSSAWSVIKTFDGTQDTNASQYTTEALVDFLTDANVAKVVGRES